MFTRTVTRRNVGSALQRRDAVEKTKSIVIDLSSSRVSLEEAASVAFHARQIRSRFNRRRSLLLLEFDTPQEKLSYLKKLPQWLWNRGCIVWEYQPAELALWRVEALN